MSTPNTKTRQLSLPEVLRDGLSGASADSEVGDPSELTGHTKISTKKTAKEMTIDWWNTKPPK